GLRTVVGDTRDYIDNAFWDEVITENEYTDLQTLLQATTDNKAVIDERFDAIYTNPDLSGSSKSNLNLYKGLTDEAYTELVTAIQNAIEDRTVNSAERHGVKVKLIDFNRTLKDLTKAFDLAIDNIAYTRAKKAEQEAKDY